MHSDVAAAARALMTVDQSARVDLAAQLVQHADWADRYTRRMGRAHPDWGCGTLSAAAQRHQMVPDPTTANEAYLACMKIVLDAVVAHRSRK